MICFDTQDVILKDVLLAAAVHIMLSAADEAEIHISVVPRQAETGMAFVSITDPSKRSVSFPHFLFIHFLFSL